MAKIGRNDPCWCESGKKFKKCHGANDATDAPHFDPDEGLQADARSLTKALLQESSARPGCHHGEAFRRLEKVAGPGAIDAYAQHVLGRSYSESELARARTIVRTMAEQVVTHAGPADLTGLCKDVANTVIGVLEREGIWCFGVAGSVQFVFSPDTHLDDRYFWVRDEGEPGSFLGHAWVVAPPFGVVDCTAKHQRWENGEGAFVPAPVLAEEVEVVAPSRRLFSANGLPALVPFPPSLEELWAWFPPFRVHREHVTVTYQPDGINLPDAPLRSIRAPRLGGRSPEAFYEQVLRPRLST